MLERLILGRRFESLLRSVAMFLSRGEPEENYNNHAGVREGPGAVGSRKANRIAADALAVRLADFQVGPEVDAAIEPRDRGLVALRFELGGPLGNRYESTSAAAPENVEWPDV